MMGDKRVVRLVGPKQREYAASLAWSAPDGYLCSYAPPTRSTAANAKFHAMLADIMKAKPEGRDLPWDVWRSLFMAEAGFKPRFEPSLDGKGVVPTGFSSSRLKVAEFADLITCVQEYGDRHQVPWSEKSPYE